VGSSITQGVGFQKAQFNTPSTAAVLIEYHLDRTCVHGVVPIEPADGIESAIHDVDALS
jgi:hypothetical protein